MAGFYVENIEKKTQENDYFREVIFTGLLSQLIVMSLQPGEDIGFETYLDTDQFVYVEDGNGKVILDGVEYELKHGTAIVVMAGTEHNIYNTSSTKALKFFIVCVPPDYADGTIHETKSGDVVFDHDSSKF